MVNSRSKTSPEQSQSLPGSTEYMETEQLKKSLESHYQDIDIENERKRKRKAQTKEKRAFDALPTQTKYEFFCINCDIDFVAPAYKNWSEIHQVGIWQSFCPRCERLVVRHTTGKKYDPYYEHSHKVRVMRGEAERDMLRPTDYGFKTLYGDPFEHYYRRFQETQEDIDNRYAALGLTGMTLDQKSEQERLNEIMNY